MHCGFVRIFFLSGSQEYEFFLYWSAMVVGVTASYSRHAAGHILFYLLYFTFYVLYFYLLYFSFSSWWQKTVFLLEQFWTSHLMFSGLALKSCVVWITKKRDIRDSIINLILQSFQNKTWKVLDFLQPRRFLACTFTEMACTIILSTKKQNTICSVSYAVPWSEFLKLF